jgi:hypothetical protein
MGDDGLAMPTTLTPSTPEEIIAAMLGGRSARYLRESIRTLSFHDYRELSCTLCCMRNEVAQERATEIDRLLAGNDAGSPPDKCRIYARSSWCPLIDAAPLDLPQGNQWTL